ncbi:hypothetical protein POTOM_014886 [Populus tomentosa]|uniref:SPARK domain-containing protein n=1 Tax=Populus tomentosa TaxID=118781 RepID=A0A8X8D7K7_POPTO|nr:hypothetical protein POTOM_014886 [Populus tomentosa]
MSYDINKLAFMASSLFSRHPLLPFSEFQVTYFLSLTLAFHFIFSLFWASCCPFLFYFSGGMSEGVSLKVKLSLSMVFVEVFLLILTHPSATGLNECHCSPFNNHGGSLSTDRRVDGFLPEISPNSAPQPLLPLLAPSPFAPFTNITIPKLSGQCTLNFTAAQSLMRTTSTDCWSIFAPLLANVICCPQLEATLAILMGQSSKDTRTLALNETDSKHCLSDIEQILAGQGAESNVNKICSIHLSNLTGGSCPVKDVNEFEGTVDSSKLLAACENIDPVKECCDQVCQNSILETATKLALKASEVLIIAGSHGLTEHSTKVDDCKHIVLRWLAGKLEPSRAKEVLRGLSNCKVNKVLPPQRTQSRFSLKVLVDPTCPFVEICPLVFPDMRHVAKGCGNEISNETECCSAMESYVSHLQKQSLITNLQALDCATTLGMKLQKSNITKDVYSLCHITLKDFSLQDKFKSDTNLFLFCYFDTILVIDNGTPQLQNKLILTNSHVFVTMISVGKWIIIAQKSGCLLPSLPSDATFDHSSGISFICDLNDNIPAPWPSKSQLSAPCNKTIKIPALPAAANAQSEELETLRAFIDMETSSFIPKGPLKTRFRETLTPVINTTNFSETGKSTPSTCVLFLKCLYNEDVIFYVLFAASAVTMMLL